MPGKKVTHSEQWWEMLAPPTVVRCEAHYKTGSRCRREAIPGHYVCRQHGGAIPAVKQAAAARIGNAADEMVKRLQAMLDDPNVDSRDKVKIMHDMLDRAGLNATNKVLLGVTELDPVEALFRDILADPTALASPHDGNASAAELEARRGAWADLVAEDDTVDAEIVEERRTPAQIEAATRPFKPRSSTPRHIREALDRLL